MLKLLLLLLLLFCALFSSSFFLSKTENIRSSLWKRDTQQRKDFGGGGVGFFTKEDVVCSCLEALL